MPRKSARESAPQEDRSRNRRAERLVNETMREERRLLNAELEAETDVLKARARYAKAADKLARRSARLSEVEQVLKQCQVARAAGPQITNADD